MLLLVKHRFNHLRSLFHVHLDEIFDLFHEWAFVLDKEFFVVCAFLDARIELILQLLKRRGKLLNKLIDRDAVGLIAVQSLVVDDKNLLWIGVKKIAIEAVIEEGRVPVIL